MNFKQKTKAINYYFEVLEKDCFFGVHKYAVGEAKCVDMFFYNDDWIICKH